MRVTRLWLTGFRNYEHLSIEFPAGVTAILGENGQGKTNLVEALSWLATLDSFRGAPHEALVRHGDDVAVIRAEVVHDDGREILIEAELPSRGRARVQVNRQRLNRTRDLVGIFRVSVFGPDDLELVKGAPAGRRRLLDDALVALDPSCDRLIDDLDRVLRQRAALLKQAGGRLDESAAMTLDIWDQRLAEFADRLGSRRKQLVVQLLPYVSSAYGSLARSSAPDLVELHYDPPWLETGLASVLREGRTEDVRRQTTLVGPHRDDLGVQLNGLPARTTASQGESRSLAFALRLATHTLTAQQHRDIPVLVLDDVFSELDAARSDALMAALPDGQVLMTTAVTLPPRAAPQLTVRVMNGTIHAGQ